MTASPTAAADSTALLAAALEQLDLGISLFDGARRLAAFNAGFARLSGLPGEVLVVGTAVTRLEAALPRGSDAADPAAARLIEHFRLVAGGRAHEMEVRCANGDVLEIKGRPVDHGGFVSTYTDASETYAALRGLGDTERRFRTIFQANPGLIAISDLTTARFDDVNDNWLAILGYRRDEVVGRTARELGIWDRIAERDRLVGLMRADGRVRGFEARFRSRDGTLRHMLIAGEMIELDGERKLLLAAHDITERKEMEARLTATLDALKKSNDELERFAFVASHDLREPLRSVSLHAQKLRAALAERLDPETDRTLDFMVSEAKRGHALLNDLVAYTQAGRRDSPLVPVAMEAVADAVLAGLAPALRDAGAVVRHHPLPPVMGDFAALTEVFHHLVHNAIKFRRDDLAAEIVLDAERSGSEWIISVRDNGIGIEPRYAEKVFSVFARLHAMSAYPGTGMGLAICKRIVERHGGRIGVEPAAAGGSVFRVTLPAA